jgi:glycerophosphoryl diester phosphodiesterase
VHLRCDRFTGIILAINARLLDAGGMEKKALPLLIAHRGESFDAPENTLAAFDLAWQRGGDAIELDVYLTSDGKLICSHDATTERTSGKAANFVIKDQPLGVLRNIDVGSWKDKRFVGEKMPTLEDVLKRMPSGKKVFVELKMGIETIPELKRVLKQANRPTQDVILICFQADVCRAAKKELAEHEVLWLVMQRPDKETGEWKPSTESIITSARNAGVNGLDIDGSQSCVNRESIEKYHAAGLTCCAWTINDPIRAKELIDAGIDAITTDRAAWLREQLSQ